MSAPEAAAFPVYVGSPRHRFLTWRGLLTSGPLLTGGTAFYPRIAGAFSCITSHFRRPRSFGEPGYAPLQHLQPKFVPTQLLAKFGEFQHSDRARCLRDEFSLEGSYVFFQFEGLAEPHIPDPSSSAHRTISSRKPA
ncbi:hypothetical protein ACFX5Q_00975 [Mesorhizobium sp. IMUNJ 23033]|uniref:hypothetical protein n=1 Tax=Mesorhizobium sp. IMUNJ 23033 TaxID=3378039 RepID=UPI00384BD693